MAITKPIFLDETGKEINESLSAIKDAILNTETVQQGKAQLQEETEKLKTEIEEVKATIPQDYTALSENVSQLSNEIDALRMTTEINLSNYTKRNGFISGKVNEYNWYYEEIKAKHILIPVVENEIYRIKANSLRQTRYAFLDYTALNFVENHKKRYDLEPGQMIEIAIPQNTKYLYLYATSDGENNFLPSLVESIGSKKTIQLDYGSLTDGFLSYNNFSLSYNGNLLRFSYDKDNYFKNRRTTNFISARSILNIEENLIGFIYEYNSSFEFIKASSIKQSNKLNFNTRYVKLHIIPSASEVDCEWSAGGFSSPDETNRIKSNLVSINSFDFITLGDISKLLYEFYDSTGLQIGEGYGTYGHFFTNSMLQYRFTSVVEGKTFEDVTHVRFAMGYFNDLDVSLNDAPKLYVYGNSDISSINITTNGVIEEKLNVGQYGETINLIYPVKTHNDNTLHYSKILLRLPKNYTNEGKPTKLIFFKTGSRGFQDITTRDFKYLDYIKYWVDEGYAVMDCHGGTSKYPTTDAFGMPTNLASVSSAWDFITSHYNIDKNGLYVSAKSLGGYIAHQLIFNGNIPIKAAALLAPAIDNKRYCFGYYKFQRENFALDAELEGDISVLQQGNDTTAISSDVQYTDDFKNLVENNINKLTGYMPMVSNVVNKSLSELLELNPETKDSYADVVRIVPVPVRYWVAEDDVDTPYNIADNMVKSAQNGNSPVSMRTMPSGTGGHHSVDNAENAPKTTITTRLGVTYTDFPIAWVEALNFMERY